MISFAPLPFDLDSLLLPGSADRKIARFTRNQIIFSHGDRSESLFYIEKGCVKLTVTSQRGKEAIIGIFDRGDLIGESCLGGGQPVRFGNAVAVTDVRAVKIDRKVLIPILRTRAQASYIFTTYLLARNIRTREDLVHNLLNSGEGRLARVLSLLARSEAKGISHSSPKVSQQTLGEMIGATRQQVNALMQRYRKSAFVENADI
jgi:CRP/FNR family cyclic AMP-dependent transcriptional regulator